MLMGYKIVNHQLRLFHSLYKGKYTNIVLSSFLIRILIMKDTEIIAFGNKILDSCKTIFPESKRCMGEPRIKCREYRRYVSWKLNNDPERKNKSSKTIILIFSRETIEDFFHKNENLDSFKKQAYSYVENKYRNLDPEHNVSRYRTCTKRRMGDTVIIIFGVVLT